MRKVQIDKAEVLRGAGTTTAGILRILARATMEPNIWHTYTDHYHGCTDSGYKAHLNSMVRIANVLGLDYRFRLYEGRPQVMAEVEFVKVQKTVDKTHHEEIRDAVIAYMDAHGVTKP